jgi:hypothetical protein
MEFSGIKLDVVAVGDCFVFWADETLLAASEAALANRASIKCINAPYHTKIWRDMRKDFFHA